MRQLKNKVVLISIPVISIFIASICVYCTAFVCVCHFSHSYVDIFCCREKKREKERDELWKKLSELELNHSASSGKLAKDTGDTKSITK
jgi:hypothetical protein